MKPRCSFFRYLPLALSLPLALLLSASGCYTQLALTDDEAEPSYAEPWYPPEPTPIVVIVPPPYYPPPVIVLPIGGANPSPAPAPSPKRPDIGNHRPTADSSTRPAEASPGRTGSPGSTPAPAPPTGRPTGNSRGVR